MTVVLKKRLPFEAEVMSVFSAALSISVTVPGWISATVERVIPPEY